MLPQVLVDSGLRGGDEESEHLTILMLDNDFLIGHITSSLPHSMTLLQLSFAEEVWLPWVCNRLYSLIGIFIIMVFILIFGCHHRLMGHVLISLNNLEIVIANPRPAWFFPYKLNASWQSFKMRHSLFLSFTWTSELQCSYEKNCLFHKTSNRQAYMNQVPSFEIFRSDWDKAIRQPTRLTLV